MIRYYIILLLVSLLFTFTDALSQTPSFYHLTTSNGLYDNHIRSLSIDHSGFLWIGTEEGLNIYDGSSVNVYLKDKYPALPSDNITRLFCDAANQMWIGTAQGVARINSNGHIERIILEDSLSKFNSKAIIETKKWGIVVITDKGQYSFDIGKKKWVQLPSPREKFSIVSISMVREFDTDKYLVVENNRLLLYDYKQNNIAREYNAEGIISACKAGSDQIALGLSNGSVVIMDALSGNILRSHQLTNYLNKNTILKPLDIQQLSDGDIIVATGLNGIITIHPSGVMEQFIHNPVDQNSLISNNAYRIATGTHGEVIIGTSTSGISMYNLTLSQAAYKGFFTDATGKYYDNYTSRMAEGKDNNIWIGAYDRLIKWNRKKNTSTFYYYEEKDGTEIRPHEIVATCFDKNGTLWVSITRKGVAYFSEASGSFIKLKTDTATSPVFKSGSVSDIMCDHHGTLWISTGKGIYSIDPLTKKIITYDHHPQLDQLSGKVIRSAFEDSKGRIWFSSLFDGVYCYDKISETISQYTTKNGLPSDICYMVAEDKKGRFFITTSQGFAIMETSGAIRSYTKTNGLRYERCESVVLGPDNMAWISNKKCLVRMDADHDRMDFFDEKAGLLNDGFRVGSCLVTKDGELLWGGYRGISYFAPGQLKNESGPLQVSIHSVSARDSIMDISGNELRIPYAANNIILKFAGIHLGIPGKTYFQYKLHGFDKEWQKGEDIRQARYASLPPGSYSFELKASIDGLHWITAPKNINIVIVPPLWMRGWFIICTLVIAILSIILFIRNRNHKIKEHKDELEAEQAINYFASSLHEQQTEETILWDVARNCIARLQFEDCVIYLLDEERNVLVQKAAYGPKSPRVFQVSEPLEIPVGKGITGSVAATGKAELIGDTSKDSRYITDDKQRPSEIAVPLIWGEKVIGVIDCEHHKKNYFTQKHLSILNTIASLCANKIIRSRAEEEKRKAQAILVNTEQKMAEVEMQALRAQMNPHFIFNCLNSINRYIVKSDQATASLYLTRFAKLIRLILDNSGSKNVMLSNELEALKLYIEMEALRFDKKFTYSIHVNKNVNADSIELPPLIIQPYVENAIWHGLLHKDGGGQLKISITLPDEGMLECTIEDNGVGRSKATALKSKSATSRKSLGMQLTENRLSLLNRHAELNASINIIDMENEQQQPAGTKVILRIPV